MIYPSEILNNMIHEVEKAFPLETPVFPTSSIRDLIENPDHPDDEGRECGEPFLNQRWIDVPAIQILDPATGTGTFLREVILQIRDTFVENNKGKSDDEIKKLWNKYVPEQLLPRINGFELMMAPYAVAHMKLAMVLKETGYDFKSEKRLNVVLTNTLEPSKSEASFLDEGEQLNFFNDPLAAEAFESDKAKNNQGINVIIGIIWISIKNIKFKYIVFMVFIVFMNVPFRIIAS